MSEFANPEHGRHVQAAPCEDCAREAKRLGYAAAAAGLVLGAGLVYVAMRFTRG